MIAWYWLLVCFWLGGLLGFFAAALMAAAAREIPAREKQ